MTTTPVLIVGAGPVGMTLALSLSQQGIASVVLNDRTTTTRHPKLDVVNCRSMEIFRQLGLADKIRAAGNPVEANQYAAYAATANGPWYGVLHDRHLFYPPVAEGRKQIAACTNGSLPLESMQRISQMYLEPILLEATVADPNIDIRLGWKVEEFQQNADGVVAIARRTEDRRVEQFRAQYLVGCDGPNSLIRRTLGIEYDGTRDLIGELYIIHFRSDAVKSLYPNNQPYWHTWLSRPGFTGLLVSPDASKSDWVLHLAYPPREGESLEAIVTSALGVTLPFEIVQSGPWRPQFLVAQRFGDDRVWMAGDATHQYMPTGGLGMNTGVTEAHNLAWKLAAMLKGWGGDRLLPSYETERIAIARRNRDHVMKCAAACFEAQFPDKDAVFDASSKGDGQRRELGRMLETRISRMYEALGIEIGYRYAGSPAICSDGSPAPAYPEIEYLPTTWPGARLPSGFLSNGAALFDHLDPTGFTLLAADNADCDASPMKTAAEAAGLPLTVVHIEEPHLIRMLERKWVLVRPDQHVCWRGDALPTDCRSIIETVRGAQS
ncbi:MULTISPECIES: FAD-dependent monooxygenase [Burkholderia]|uniref:FAD-dependent monooxygenase n=1 Tax=Burkholderia TaxID=32008 RepID=UPI002AB09A2B|nr:MULTISPECIES: FAD-dependent monooxygenase [Burkholderia]